MRLKYIYNAISLVLIYFGIVTFTPIIVAILDKDYYSIIPFITVGLGTTLIGGLIRFIFKNNLTKEIMSDLKKSEGLATVVLSWITFSIVASIPYLFYGFSIENSLFEGISGVSSTGATIFTNFNYPKTLFFWRAFTQWIGGMGIIILFIAILPQFSVAGRQMFFAEAPGPTEEKLTPRIKNTATTLWGLYIVITLLEIILLYYFKVPIFDAICHSFTTISAGGFSLYPDSINVYSNIVNWIIIFFMFIAGCNFALIYKFITNKFNLKLLFKSEEFRYYLGIILILSSLISLSFYVSNHCFNFNSYTNILFSTISLLTSTGYAITDYTHWTIPAQILLFTSLFFGSCAGSTGGGIKIMRILILFKYLKKEIIKILHPNAIITIKIDNNNVNRDVISQIVAFVIFYIIFFILSAIIVSIIESNIIVGITGSLATINIAGPAFGHIIGPMGNFDSLHTLSKIIFMFNMLLGRLELIPFLILLNKDFWTIKNKD